MFLASSTPHAAPTVFGLDLGTLPAWASVIVAAIAAFIALSTYRKNSAEKRESQARLVWADLNTTRYFQTGEVVTLLDEDGVGYVYTGELVSTEDLSLWERDQGRARRSTLSTVVEFHNDSDELILMWQYWIGDHGLQTSYEVSNVWGSVPPKTTRRYGAIEENHHGVGQPALLVGVRYQDGSGKVWERMEGGPIKHVPLWRTPKGERWHGNGKYSVRAIRRLIGILKHVSSLKRKRRKVAKNIGAN